MAAAFRKSCQDAQPELDVIAAELSNTLSHRMLAFFFYFIFAWLTRKLVGAGRREVYESTDGRAAPVGWREQRCWPLLPPIKA